MLRNRILLLTAGCFAVQANAQQFIGLSLNNYSAVQQIPFNPAWVNNADNGLEVNLFSASGLAGTNAYTFSKNWVTGGMGNTAIENQDYIKTFQDKQKMIWGNMDVMGPGFSTTVGKIHSIGLYTRTREIVRGGGINNDMFRFIGNLNEGSFDFTDTTLSHKFAVGSAGFTVHAFSEIGFSYGRILKDDLYHVWKAGVTVKYLMGIAAGTLKFNNVQMVKNAADSLNTLTGEANVLYTSNIRNYVDGNVNNDPGSWFGDRRGKGSLGLDFGIQYEYHPEGDPNHQTPYAFSFAASITDMGAITYNADTLGSGLYQMRLNKRVAAQLQKYGEEPLDDYMQRIRHDSLIVRQDMPATFRVGLPTALRINTDWRLLDHFYIQANMVLNLRGSNNYVYSPAYSGYFNVTPRFETRGFMFGVPVTYMSHQTMMVGATLRLGPLFLGSSSIVTTAIAKNLRNADGYAGLVLKFRKKQQMYPM